MTDPASLNVSVSIAGLGNYEAAAVFANLPAGSTASVSVTKPAIGSKRYAITAQGLSILGAKDLTTALFLHLKQIEDQGDTATATKPRPSDGAA